MVIARAPDWSALCWGCTCTVRDRLCPADRSLHKEGFIHPFVMVQTGKFASV